jgi:lysophospholipase L1-like esterase
MVDPFNAVNAAITNEMGIRYFDITPASRQSVPGFVANDGLHPSGLQYSAWVDVMEEGVFEMLQP